MLMGFAFSVHGFTRGDHPPTVGEPQYPCWTPSLPRRCLCSHRTGGKAPAEGRGSPQKTGRHPPVSAHSTRGPGWPGLTEQVHGRAFTEQTPPQPQSSRTLPKSSMGFPAFPVGHLPGTQRRAFAEYGSKDLQTDMTMPQQRRSEDSKRAGGNAPKHAGNMPQSRSPNSRGPGASSKILEHAKHLVHLINQ